MAEPVNGVAYTVPAFGLDSVLSASFQVNPTIAAGDFTISKDFGTFANLATLPVVSPSGSSSVKIVLSAAEMTADKIRVLGVDAAGGEWNDIEIILDVPSGSAESAFDILAGDHIESRTSLVINKKDTTTAVLSKTISGSLLSEGITITTLES